MAGAIGSIGGPTVAKSAADHIVKAPVLTPGEPDRERHRYSAENIAEIAQSFPPDGSIDAMHAGGDVGHPTESYVAPQPLDFDGRTVPAGSWMIGAKIANDQMWQGVESGEYQGVSVLGPVHAVYDGDDSQLDIKEIARPVGGSGGAGRTASDRQLRPRGTHPGVLGGRRAPRDRGRAANDRRGVLRHRPLRGDVPRDAPRTPPGVRPRLNPHRCLHEPAAGGQRLSVRCP